MASVGEKRFPAGRGMGTNGGIVRRTRAPLADAAFNKTSAMTWQRNAWPQSIALHVAHNVRLTFIAITVKECA